MLIYHAELKQNDFYFLNPKKSYSGHILLIHDRIEMM